MAAVVALSLLLGALWAWRSELARQQAWRDQAGALAHDTAQSTRFHLDRALSAVHAMAALVQESNGQVRDFDRVAAQMQPNYPGASILILAPGGVIAHAVPLAGNEKAIGLNLLADPVMRAEAERARRSAQLTLAGPLPLRQGGQGLVARLPIYLDQPGAPHGFWGFANVVLRLPQALESVPLAQFERAGLDYSLWRSDPYKGAPQAIAGLAASQLQNPVQISFEVPNGVWNLAVAPHAGWASGHHGFAHALGVLALAALLGHLTRLQLGLLRQRRVLESEVQQRTAEITAARAQLQATMDAVPDALIEVDAQGVARSFHAPVGHVLTDTLRRWHQQPCTQAWSEAACASLQQALADAVRDGHARGQRMHLHAGGLDHWFELSLARKPQASGESDRYILIAHDITARKHAEDHVAQLAYHDVLTGLPNRALYEDRLRHALGEASRRNERLSVMFVDLDHFKNVNDTLGHRVGDRLLQVVAERMRASVREQDTVARLGGDEFVLVLPDTGTRGSARVGHKLLQALAQPLCIDGHDLSITGSIGVAIYPEDGPDSQLLAQHADAAMYQAKREGRSALRFFTESLQVDAARTLQLDNELRRALERNQFEVYYQPQMALDSGRLLGVEALLRWHHPELGWVSPAEFIPVAETSGQIVAIGEWVLREAITQIRRWQLAGLPLMSVAVNLSAVQFRQPNLIERVHALLEQAQLAPRWLEIELTESVAQQDPERAAALMGELASLGVHLAIDDFGTGYSSLSYLKRFAVHQLKIDQSFVRDLTQDADDLAIVRAIVSMARSLGLATLAEGVETQAQLDILRELGCDAIQGYLYSRPQPPAQLEAFLQGQS